MNLVSLHLGPAGFKQTCARYNQKSKTALMLSFYFTRQEMSVYIKNSRPWKPVKMTLKNWPRQVLTSFIHFHQNFAQPLIPTTCIHSHIILQTSSTPFTLPTHATTRRITPWTYIVQAGTTISARTCHWTICRDIKGMSKDIAVHKTAIRKHWVIVFAGGGVTCSWRGAGLRFTMVVKSFRNSVILPEMFSNIPPTKALCDDLCRA